MASNAAAQAILTPLEELGILIPSYLSYTFVNHLFTADSLPLLVSQILLYFGALPLFLYFGLPQISPGLVNRFKNSWNNSSSIVLVYLKVGLATVPPAVFGQVSEHFQGKQPKPVKAKSASIIVTGGLQLLAAAALLQVVWYLMGQPWKEQITGSDSSKTQEGKKDE